MTKQGQALVVDDEEGIRIFLQEVLQEDGYAVSTAASVDEALAQLRDACFDLVLLDLKLGSRGDGLRILEAVKWRWPETVVIILTAHASLESTLAAIREGVNGYLLKPAEPEDIRQTIRAALARRTESQPARSSADQPCPSPGGLLLDVNKHQAVVNGRPVQLTPAEFQLLAHLMQNAQRVIPPRELVRVVQGYEAESDWEAREIIKWYIHRLRRKVETDPAHPRYILNVRGVGYQLENS